MARVISKESLANKEFVEKLTFNLVEKLRGGSLLGVALENGYIIVADPSDEDTVQKLKAIKSLSEDFYFPVLLPNLESLAELAEELTPTMRLVASHFWPGPLNMEFAAKKGLPWNLGASFQPQTIIARMPKNKILRSLLNLTGPLLFTSAASRGGNPCLSVTEISAANRKHLDLIVNTGPCSLKSNATTIVFTGKGARITREGSIAAAQLRKVVPEISTERS